MAIIYLEIRLKRIVAVVRVNLSSRECSTVKCSNAQFCRNLGINCPPYCEIIVAAKDYAYGRRRPKADISEISESDIEFILAEG
jgi:uncharacterized protein (UPF0179 family)